MNRLLLIITALTGMLGFARQIHAQPRVEQGKPKLEQGEQEAEPADLTAELGEKVPKQLDQKVEQRVESILSKMTLDQKLSYIGGAPFFDVKPIPLADLKAPLNPQILQMDASLGVRVSPSSVRYPSGKTLSATWNPSLARAQGAGLGRDTRARGFFSLLGPGMNFYRTPFDGRNSEYMTGEDPFLGSKLIPPLIQAIQEKGVWACAKHVVAYDQRTGTDVTVDERTLREIYLPPFEAAIKLGQAATVMGAFNKINGEFASEDHFTLTQVLKEEWGCKGFVMSDYNSIHDGVKGALGGCDLDLPDGEFMNSNNLLPAINSGQVPVSLIDDKVRRILRKVVSFGFLDRQQLDNSIPLDDPSSERTALNIDREGMVLLKNAGNILPLSVKGPGSIAVMGSAALGLPPFQFGSAWVPPIRVLSELAGVQQEAGPQVKVDLISACTLDPATSPWESSDASNQVLRGLKGEYFTSPDLSGTPAVTRVDNQVDFDWEQDPIPVAENKDTFSARWTGRIVSSIGGDQVFKICADGGVRLIVDGVTLFDNFASPPAPDFRPTLAFFAKIPATAGQVLAVELQYHRTPGFSGSAFIKPAGGVGGLRGVQLSWASLQPPPDIAKYNAVIVCAGTSAPYEGEGLDRPFQLPEFQDELIKNVSLANPRTIVVLHGGGSFDVQQWINYAAGLLHVFFPGQNGGQALGEILFGDVNPSGKLPITWERRIEDNPAYATFPKPLNKLPAPIEYSEGIFVGYRGYEKNGIKPQFPFGFGLSYTTFGYSSLNIKPAKKGSNHLAEVSF